jgi:hypothetical protein
MERVDIVVTGLDPARPRAEVIAALAQRLARSAADITLLLEVAPAPLVRAVSSAEAERMLRDLGALGVRVKLRKAVPEAAGHPAPASPEIVPLPSKHDRELAIEAAPEADAPDETRSAPTKEPTEQTPREPAPIVVHSASEWFGGASHAPPAPSGPAAPPLEDAAALLSPIRFASAEAAERERLRPPRVFLHALPKTLLLALDPVVLRGALLAGALGVTGIALGTAGLRFDLQLGPFLVTLGVLAGAGFVGLVLSLVATCLSAASLGERAPSALPGRLMEDYLRPGGGVFLVLGILGFIGNTIALRLATLHATRLTFGLLWAPFAIYGALGFVLSAANGSALGFVDGVRMGRLFTRAPGRAVAMLALVALLLGGSGLGLGRVLLLAASAPSFASSAFFLVVLAPIATLAFALAAAASGAVMGQLVYANK